MTKTIFGKVRKALGNVGSDVREGTCFQSREARAEQVNLIKVGGFWWFLRNKKFLRKSWELSSPLPLLLLTGLKTTPFSDVTAGCATIFGHVRLSPFFLLFLRISVRFCFCFCLKNEFQIRFSPVFFHRMTKSTSDRWSSPLIITTPGFEVRFGVRLKWDSWKGVKITVSRGQGTVSRNSGLYKGQFHGWRCST